MIGWYKYALQLVTDFPPVFEPVYGPSRYQHRRLGWMKSAHAHHAAAGGTQLSFELHVGLLIRPAQKTLRWFGPQQGLNSNFSEASQSQVAELLEYPRHMIFAILTSLAAR